MIIGIGGKIGSGKSTAADYLVKHYGFKEVCFADNLKLGAQVLFGLNPEQTHGAFKEKPDRRFDLTPREVMQRLGDGCREIWPQVFVDSVLRFIWTAGGSIVVSDVRFLNEFMALHRAGAVLCRVIRNGSGSQCGRDEHRSEKEAERWPYCDIEIVNNGSLEELYRQIDSLVRIGM